MDLSDAKSKGINNEQVLHEHMNGDMSLFSFLAMDLG